MQISKEQARKREKLVDSWKEKARKGNLYAVQKLEDFGVQGDNFAFQQEVCGEPPHNSL